MARRRCSSGGHYRLQHYGTSTVYERVQDWREERKEERPLTKPVMVYPIQIRPQICSIRTDVWYSTASPIIQPLRRIEVDIALIEWIVRYVSLQILLHSRILIARPAKNIAEAPAGAEDLRRAAEVDVHHGLWVENGLSGVELCGTDGGNTGA